MYPVYCYLASFSLTTQETDLSATFIINTSLRLEPVSGMINSDEKKSIENMQSWKCCKWCTKNCRNSFLFCNEETTDITEEEIK